MAKSSREYWRDREEAQRARNITDEAEYRREIERIHRQIMREAQKEISDFYVKYATKNGITLSEAKRRVRRLDMKEYSEKAKEYVKNRDFSAQANAEMELYNLTMKVNRLEMLKADIGMHLVGGYDELQKYFEEELTDTALEEFQRQAGILGNTIQNNAELAHGIVNASFHNASFSDRIWGQYAGFKSALEREITRGLLQGLGSDQLAANIRKTCSEVSARDALRLMVTEMARVRTEVAKQSMEKNGNTEYEFMALGQHPCPVCRGLNGKIFKVKDLMPGENAPPMHPWCHCSTAPHWDEEKYQAWLDSGAAKAGVPFGEFEVGEESEKMSAANDQPYRWGNAIPHNVSKADIEGLIRYGDEQGVRVKHIDSFDGDIALFKSVIDKLSELHEKFPVSRKNPTITITDFLDGKDYADTTKSGVIRINRLCLRDRSITEDIMRTDGIFQSSKVEDIITHEYGHVLSHRYGNCGIEITRKAYYNLNGKEITADEALKYLYTNISSYATKYSGDYEDDFFSRRISIKKYTEIIPEVLVKHVNRQNDFTEEFMRLLFND